MIENRYIASPYSYHGDSSRRSWSVWDRKNECWVSGDTGGVKLIGTKQEAETLAETMTDTGYNEGG